MSDFTPGNVILHDYGGTPRNEDGVFNPYHTLVFPDGSVRYRYPDAPYGQPAPHAYRMNPESIGLSYAGQVGATPTPEAMTSLRREYEAIQRQFPGIRTLSHGEAYNATRGTPRQASRAGRGLDEAAWRQQLLAPQAPSQWANPTLNTAGVVTTAAAPAAAPVPLAERAMTFGHPAADAKWYSASTPSQPLPGWGMSLPPAAALEHAAGLASAPGGNMALAAALPAGEQMFAQGQRAAQEAEAGVPVRSVQTVALDGNGQPPAPAPYKLLNPGAADAPRDWVSTTIDAAPKPQLAAADPLAAPPAAPTRSQSGLTMPGTRSALGGPKPQAPPSPDGAPMGRPKPASAWWENVNGDMTPKFLSDSRPALPMPKAPDMTPKVQNNPFKSFFGGWFA